MVNYLILNKYYISYILSYHLDFLFYILCNTFLSFLCLTGARVSNAHLVKLVLAWWVIAPPACCLMRSSRRLAGVQPAPPLLWMRSVQSNYLFKEHYMQIPLNFYD